MGARALPSTVLSPDADLTPDEPGPLKGVDELQRLRLENETLSAVVGVVSSGPDLGHILDRVVDLLTRATDCHACFVYLRRENGLTLRAASPIYSHLIGKVRFTVDQGLAGWSVRHGEPAFIREGANADPRTHYVPELEEERFQSVVAVPVPARDGAAIGAIVLHTVAPREFDERILNVLSRAAALVAGAIENARLYEDAQDRVAALTRLAVFGRDVAAVGDRRELFEVAVRGTRELLGVDLAVAYRADGPQAALRYATGVPAGALADDQAGAEVADVLAGGDPGLEAQGKLLERMQMSGPGAVLDAVELSIRSERVGAILVASQQPWRPTTRELLRAAAQGVALAAEKIALIEYLTQENLARDLFDALGSGELEAAAEKLQAAGLFRDQATFVLEAREPAHADSGAKVSEQRERDLKAMLPRAFCDLSRGSLRALIPVTGVGAGSVVSSIESLDHSGVLDGLVVGASEARAGIGGMAEALLEARDAVKVAERLGRTGSILSYEDTGAYRYVIDLLDGEGPQDSVRSAIEVLLAYDRERGTQLVHTLDIYLSNGRMISATARALFIHVNTLRQRLDRIDELTGLKIAKEEILALHIAVKLVLLSAG